MSGQPVVEMGPKGPNAIPEILNPGHVLAVTADVLSDFDITADPVREPDAFDAQVKRTSPRYQGDDVPYLVRYAADHNKAYPPRAEARIMAVAGSLAMLNGVIPFVEGSSPDAIIALGGAGPSNRERLEAGVLPDERWGIGLPAQVGDERIGIVTAPRVLAKPESELTAGRVIDADYRSPEEREKPTEHTLGRAAVRVVGDATGNSRLLHVEAPAGARTAATVEAAVRALGLQKGQRLGLVTNPIYVAPQGLAARIAEIETGVEMLIAGRKSRPDAVAKRGPATYLSEMLTAAGRAARLKRMLQERG